MLPQKPYLFNALYRWIIDSRCSPYIVVKATVDGVKVPQDYVDGNNEIVLDISPCAISDFCIGDRLIEFSADFHGISHPVSIPIRAILAIYAGENGRGMVFEEDDDDPQEDVASSVSIDNNSGSSSKVAASY